MKQHRIPGRWRLWAGGLSPVERVRRESAGERAELLAGLGDHFADKGDHGLAQWHWREAGRAEARSWGVRPRPGVEG